MNLPTITKLLRRFGKLKKGVTIKKSMLCRASLTDLAATINTLHSVGVKRRPTNRQENKDSTRKLIMEVEFTTPNEIGLSSDSVVSSLQGPDLEEDNNCILQQNLQLNLTGR